MQYDSQTSRQTSPSGSERRLPMWAVVILCVATVGLGTVVACKLLPPSQSQPGWWLRAGWLVLAGEALLYAIAGVLIGARRPAAIGAAILVGLVARGLMAAAGLALSGQGAASPEGIQKGIHDMLVGDMTRTVVEAMFVVMGVLLPLKSYLSGTGVASQAPKPQPVGAAQPAPSAQMAPGDLSAAHPGLQAAVPAVAPTEVEPAVVPRHAEAPTAASDVAPPAERPLAEPASAAQAPRAPTAPRPPGPVLTGFTQPFSPLWDEPEEAPQEAAPSAAAVQEAVEAPAEPEPAAPAPELGLDLPEAAPVPETTEEPPTTVERVAEEPPAPEPEAVEPTGEFGLFEEADRGAEGVGVELEAAQLAIEPAPELAPEPKPEEPGALPIDDKAKLEELVDQLMASARVSENEEAVEVVAQPPAEEPEAPSVPAGPLFSFEIEEDQQVEGEEQPAPRPAREQPSEPGQPVFRVSGDGLRAAREEVPSAFGSAPPRPARPEPVREAREPAPAAAKAAVAADLSSQVVYVSAEAILPQFPDGALTIAPDEVESVFSDMRFEVPLELIVHQLKEGEVRVPPRAIVPQMPPGCVAASDVELDAALAEGIELPLGEIVPQIPPALLRIAASPQSAPEVPEEDIFAVPGHPGFAAGVTVSPHRGALPEEEEAAEVAAAEPSADLAAEDRDWESLLADVGEPGEPSAAPPPHRPPEGRSIRVSAEAVLSQIPASAFVRSPEDVLASMDEPHFVFDVEDVVGQLKRGQVVVGVAAVASQLPLDAFQLSPGEIDSALPDGGIELPLFEVVPQLGSDALAIAQQAPAPELGDEVLFDEDGAHALAEEPPTAPEPVAAEPAAPQQVPVEPIAAEPELAEPVPPEPAAVEPAAPEPVAAEPSPPEMVMAEPAAPESAPPEPEAAPPPVEEVVAEVAETPPDESFATRPAPVYVVEEEPEAAAPPAVPPEEAPAPAPVAAALEEAAPVAPPQPEPVAPEPVAPEPAPAPAEAVPVAEVTVTRLAAEDAVRGALSPIVGSLGVLTSAAVASPAGAMVCVLPEGLDCRAPAESGGALLQSARSLSERAGHGALSAMLVTAEAGCAFIGIGQAAGEEPVVCQIVARGVDNVGKVAMTAHKALAALKDITIQSPGARPPDATTGQAVPADAPAGETGEDGFDLQGAARAAGAGLAAGLFECQTGTRLAAFGPPESVGPDVAGSAGAVLNNATTYSEVVGLGRVHKVMLEGAGGLAALAAPPKPDMPFVLLMPASAVKLGLISVQVGKVAAALAASG